ncbi:MAG: hypothetical protein ACR2PR_09200 [Pseudohongiellaceae bacterium]
MAHDNCTAAELRWMEDNNYRFCDMCEGGAAPDNPGWQKTPAFWKDGFLWECPACVSERARTAKRAA